MGEDPASPAATVRRLIRAGGRATLATLLAGDGGPYASLVLIACDLDAAPLLLLSDLADHSRNLAADPRASLLVDATAGMAEPLAGERASLVGTIVPSDLPRHRARYLARHPSAARYAAFADFRLYRMAIERAHLVAGFGRIAWVPGAAVLQEEAAAGLAPQADDILDHLNHEHQDTLQLYAWHLGEAEPGWRAVGIDPDGLDLAREGQQLRLAFARPVDGPEAARAELVRLARAARAARDG